MRFRDFLASFSSLAIATWILNVAWLAMLAAPLSWLWNHAVVPLGGLPAIGYGRTFSLLLFWFLLGLAHVGVKVAAKSQASK